MYYSGIGSRETPPAILAQFEQFAYIAANRGLILRSGGADGADSAFEQGAINARGMMEIFLPWKGFNNNTSTLISPSADAYRLAATIHPAWNNLRRPAKLLVARNMHQVMGLSLKSPVKFVICYTSDGCESHETYGRQTGGTGSALKLASLNGIPIFNVANQDRFIDATEYMLELTGANNDQT
jgi:hypothetical protein